MSNIMYEAVVTYGTGEIKKYRGTLEYILGEIGDETPKEMCVSREVAHSEQEKKNTQLEGQGKETKAFSV